jgi:DNA-binding beta-propeller fold protein YncE
MNRKALILAGALAALAGAWAAPSQAKDLFYYIGYDVVQVLDGDTDTVTATIPAKGWLRDVAASADRKTLFVTANRHLIHKIDLAKGAVVKTVDVNGDGWERLIYGLTVAPSGKSAYAHLLFRTTKDGEALTRQPVVAELDLEDGKVLRSVEVPWGLGNLVGTEDGKTLFGVGQDLVRIDTTGKELKVVESRQLIEKGMNTLPFWPKNYDNNGIAVAPYYTPTAMGVLMIDTKTGEVTDKVLKDISMVYTLVLSPDRKKAYGNMDDVVAYDFETGAITKSVVNDEGTNFDISISSDGKKLYTAAGGYTMTVYDAETLKALKVVQMASDGMGMIRLTN